MELIEVDHEDAVPSAFVLFLQTAQVVLKYADSYLYRRTRLSVIKLIVLKILASSSGDMAPSRIAELTNRGRNNITTLVGRMKRDGLVTAKRNSSNKRLVNINLTGKGREVLSQAMPVEKEIFNQVMLSITEDDAELLKKKLTILRQNAQEGGEIWREKDTRCVHDS